MGKQTNNQRTTPRGAGDRVWDSLRVIHQNMAAYTAIPLTVTPFLRDQTLLLKVQENSELNALEAQAKMLASDVRRFKNDLEEIFLSHSQRRGNSSSPDDMMLAIQVFERYQEWAHSYDRVILPTIQEIAAICLRGGQRLGESNGVPAMSAAQSFAQVAQSSMATPESSQGD